MLYITIWYVSISYEGEGRTAEQFFLHPHNNRTYRDVPNCNIQHKNALENGLLKSETC